MDALILLFFILVRFSCVSGFLIMLTPRRLCLLSQSQIVILGQCDVTSPAQQWEWLGGTQLINILSSRCLWADPSPHLPLHTRLAKLCDCSSAPAWSCDNKNGAFGLAETHMYLKKQGLRVVIGGHVQTSEWRKYDEDSGGNQLLTSLCPKTDTTPLATIFYSSTLSSTINTIRSPTMTVTNEQLSNTVKIQRTTRQLTTLEVHASPTNGTSAYVNDITKPRTRRSATTEPDASTSVTELSALNSSQIISSSPSVLMTDRSVEVSESSSTNNPESFSTLRTEAETSEHRIKFTMSFLTSGNETTESAAVTLASSTVSSKSDMTDSTDPLVTSDFTSDFTSDITAVISDATSDITVGVSAVSDTESAYTHSVYNNTYLSPASSITTLAPLTGVPSTAGTTSTSITETDPPSTHHVLPLTSQTSPTVPSVLDSTVHPELSVSTSTEGVPLTVMSTGGIPNSTLTVPPVSPRTTASSKPTTTKPKTPPVTTTTTPTTKPTTTPVTTTTTPTTKPTTTPVTTTTTPTTKPTTTPVTTTLRTTETDTMMTTVIMTTLTPTTTITTTINSPPTTPAATTTTRTTTAPPPSTLQTTTSGLTSTTPVQSTKASRCSVNFTEVPTHTDCVMVKFSTAGLYCNFTAFTDDHRQADCNPDRESRNAFVCQILGLEPGTLYSLIVISLKDGERSNMSVRTGENATHPHLENTVQVQLLNDVTKLPLDVVTS